MNIINIGIILFEHNSVISQILNYGAADMFIVTAHTHAHTRIHAHTQTCMRRHKTNSAPTNTDKNV